MTIGRISGPLLKENLLRDGVNLRFENDLIYLKVTDPNGANHRVGIKNSNPAYTLDVTGTIRGTTLLGGELDVDEIYINNNTISSQIGDLVLSAATGTDKVKINSNVLINGDLHATGSITADGSLQLGDQNTDNVVFAADINSDFMPNITDTYNLGGTAQRWKNLTVQTADIGDVSVTGNTIQTLNTNGDLFINANGTGSVIISNLLNLSGGGGLTFSGQDVTFNNLYLNGDGQYTRIQTLDSNTDLHLIAHGTGNVKLDSDTDVTGDFTVSGTSNLTGNLTIGSNKFTVTASNGNTNIAGSVTANSLVINTTSTLTGPVTANNNVQIAGTLTVTGDIVGGPIRTDDIQIVGNRIETTASNSNFEVNTVGTGSIELLANTNVNGTFVATGLITSQTGVQVNDLTAGRITYAGVNGRLVDSPSLTYNGTTLSLTGNISVTGGTTSTINGITITGTTIDSADSSGITFTPAVTFNSDVSVENNLYVRNKITTDNMLIQGNLTVLGTQTVINSSSFSVTDGLIYLGENNQSNVIDLGFVASFNDGVYQHTGLVRDATDGKWKLFESVIDEPGLTVNFGQATYSTLKLDTLEASTILDANLTNGRVVLAGVNGELEDSANLTFDGTTLTVTGDQHITGDLTVDGDITLGGNIRIGDQDVDTVTVVADFTSDLFPNTSNTYDIGRANKQWRTLYAAEFDNSVININDNTIRTTVSNANLELIANGAGIISIPSSDVTIDQNLTVNGTSTLNVAIVNGTFTANDPSTFNDTVDINNTLTVNGTTNFNGAVVNNGDMTVNGYLTVINDITTSAVQTDDIRVDGNVVTTTLSNSNLELRANGTGTIELQDNTNITGELSVTGNVNLQGPNLNISGFTLINANVQINKTLTVAEGIWASNLQVDDIFIQDNTIKTSSSNSNLELLASGTGTIELQSSTNITGDLTVSNQGTFKTLIVNETTTLTGPVTASNDVQIAGTLTVTGDIVGGPLITDDIRIAGNRIETTASNSNLELHTVGTGTIELQDNTNVTGNLDVSSQATLASANVEDLTAGRVVLAGVNGELEDSANLTFDGTTLTVTGDQHITGDLTVDGDITLGGNIKIGDTTLDTVTVVADFTSDLIPNDSNTYDLGTVAKQWRVVNAAEFDNGVININDNVITTTVSNADLELRASGTGTILVPQNDVSFNQALTVTGLTTLNQTTINGILTVNNDSTFVGNVGVTGNLTVTGNTTQTGDYTVDGNLVVTKDITTSTVQTDDILIEGNVITTTLSNSNLELRAVGTGTIELQENTNVTGTLTVDTSVTSPVGNITVLNANEANIDGIKITNNFISTVQSNANLELRPSGSGIVYIDGTGAFRIPTGTTAERPAVGDFGFIRYNSQTNNIEAWNGVVFTGISGGSSSDANGDTRITYETGGNNEDIIRFYTGIAGDLPGSTVGSVEHATISADGLTVDGDIRLRNNVIETTVSNSNLELQASGTGKIYVPTNNVEIDNNLTVNGGTYLNTLNVTGTSTLNYTEIDELVVGGIVRIGGNVIENINTNQDLIIRARGTGRVILDGAGDPGGSGNVFATDPLLTLNSAQTDANTFDSGLIIERGSDINKGVIWDESEDAFAFISTIEQGTVRGNVSITDYQDVHVASVKLNSESINKVTFTDANKIVRTIDSGELAYVDGVIKFNTGAEAAIPTGTTAQRPATPQEGTIRFNTSDLAFEGYAEGAWRQMGFGSGTAPTYQGFLANGTDFEFTLSQVPLSAAAIMVAINGVVQEPEIAYTVDGDILRFIDDTSTVVAPDANDRIDVRFLSMPAVTTVHTVNFVADGLTATFDTNYTIPNEECVMVFVNSVYQDTEVYSINGSEVTFVDETPSLDDRINIVIFPTIIAPDLPTKTYVDQQITNVSNTATDDAIAFAIALG